MPKLNTSLSILRAPHLKQNTKRNSFEAGERTKRRGLASVGA